MKKLSTVLTETANLVHTVGLAKNELVDFKGRVCAIGGLTKVLTGDADLWCMASMMDECLPAMHLLTEAINDLDPTIDIEPPAETRDYVQIVTWNNDYNRTKDEVVKAFCRAAMIAESIEMSEQYSV